MKTLYIILFSLLFSSCGNIISEMNAHKKNEEGLRYMNNGEHEKAIEAFKEAIKSPNIAIQTRAVIYRNISMTYLEIPMQDSALRYSTMAANCYPKDSYEYLINISDVDLMNNKTRQAIENLNKAYEMKPNDLSVNNSLGLIYLGEYGTEYQDLSKGLKHNKQAYSINKDRVTEYILARNYYELEQYDLAERHLENLNRNYPDIAIHPLSLGMTKYKLNKKQEAEEIWDELLRNDSTYIYGIESFKMENDSTYSETPLEEYYE